MKKNTSKLTKHLISLQKKILSIEQLQPKLLTLKVEDKMEKVELSPTNVRRSISNYGKINIIRSSEG